MNRIILHSDCNNFYASVECLYNPAIRNKPIAVCGNEELRHGIVLAKNYIAKKYNIQTGDTIWMAKKKCNDLIVVPPHFDRYLQFSKLAKQIYNEYTNQVESFGLDECWLDVTGSTSLFGDGKIIANKIRNRIKEELGITVSIGVSFNKIFAKLGSDMKKPDAITVINQTDFKEIVWKLPVNDLLNVGKSTFLLLKKYSIHTIGDLANTNVNFLKSKLGKRGISLWNYANGKDDSPVLDIQSNYNIKSISNSTTTPRDLTTEEDIKIILLKLSESVASKLRDAELLCNTVQLDIRKSNLSTIQRQGKLFSPTNNSTDIFKKSFQIFKQHIELGEPIRSMGVRVCNLVKNNNTQMNLFSDINHSQRNLNVDIAVDKLRKRFGHFSVQRGIMLSDTKLSDFNPKEDNIIHPISYM